MQAMAGIGMKQATGAGIIVTSTMETARLRRQVRNRCNRIAPTDNITHPEAQRDVRQAHIHKPYSTLTPS